MLDLLCLLASMLDNSSLHILFINADLLCALPPVFPVLHSLRNLAIEG